MKLLQNKFVPALFLFCAAYALAYIPGESGFVSLENEHGIWGNPAGLAAFDSGDYVTAFQCFQKAADAGLAGGQYNLGICWRDGSAKKSL